MITLTTEQAQQIEEALLRVEQNAEECMGDDGMVVVVPLDLYNELTESLATIRAARAQADHIADADKMVREPVAVVDANDDGYWADILPDRSVKVGQKLYAAPVEPVKQEPVATHICNLWVDPITKEYVVDHCDHPIDELIPAYAAPVQQAEQEPTSKTKALDYAILTLHSIACLTQGNNLLWWQKSARNALAKIDELLREQSVATYQEPASRAILCPPPPPEVYQMRSRDAYEAGWYEAQKQKAVSPTAPVQPIEDSRVSMWKSRYLAAASDRSKLIEENNALRAAPVRTKDLTDDEILAVARGIGIVFDESDKEQQIDDIQVFARAAIAADRAQSDLKTKQVEVEIAKQEAIRIQTLNSNSQAIPADFKGMFNVGKQ